LGFKPKTGIAFPKTAIWFYGVILKKIDIEILRIFMFCSTVSEGKKTIKCTVLKYLKKKEKTCNNNGEKCIK